MMMMMMMDFIGFLVVGVIAVFSGVAAVVIGIEYTKKTYFFEDLFENILKNVSSDEELQKLLYQVGGIIGQGVKAGAGITAKSGRFKWSDLLSDLAGEFLKGSMARPPSPLQPQLSPTQQDGDKSKKW